jgi:hypothetical protein
MGLFIVCIGVHAGGCALEKTVDEVGEIPAQAGVTGVGRCRGDDIDEQGLVGLGGAKFAELRPVYPWEQFTALQKRDGGVYPGQILIESAFLQQDPAGRGQLNGQREDRIAQRSV